MVCKFHKWSTKWDASFLPRTDAFHISSGPILAFSFLANKSTKVREGNPVQNKWSKLSAEMLIDRATAYITSHLRVDLSVRSKVRYDKSQKPQTVFVPTDINPRNSLIILFQPLNYYVTCLIFINSWRSDT